MEAIRSMLEWMASVRIATDPVIVPANTLSRIKTELETTDNAAVRVFTAGTSPDGVVLTGSFFPQPPRQRPHRSAAVTDLVLGLIAELGHRQTGAAGLVGNERRVIAKAAGPVWLAREPPAALAEEHALDAGPRIDVGERAHVAQPAARRRLAQQLVEVLPIGRVRSREPR